MLKARSRVPKPGRPLPAPMMNAHLSRLACGLLIVLAGCATAPGHALSTEEGLLCRDFSLDCSAGFPGLSEEDRAMWASGGLHQPQCVMDAEGQMTCE